MAPGRLLPEKGGGVSWRPGIGNFQAGWWLGNLLDAPWVILGGVDLLHDVQGFTSTGGSPTDLDNLEEEICRRRGNPGESHGYTSEFLDTVFTPLAQTKEDTGWYGYL